MRLAVFLEANLESILREWEPFAATLLPAARHMDSTALRDHASEIVLAIAADLRNAQTPMQQDLKARGMQRAASAANTAAQTHAVLRAIAGFTPQQLVSEYRALRASVIRLWLGLEPSADQTTLEDIIRFNEAIDQAVAESVDHFTQEVDKWRSVFLGVLGHELRGPLDAILLTANVLERLPEGTRSAEYIARMTRSGQRMRSLLDDLLDFNRGSLGFGIAVKPAPMNMADVCVQEIELRGASAPNAQIVFEAAGDTSGHWDADRVRQLLGNLLSNALKYGDATAPVTVRLRGQPSDVTLSVSNVGTGVPADRVERLFKPLHRERSSNERAERESLGLGLYIVKAIAEAHRASVSATSSDGTTVFTVIWPRIVSPEVVA